MKPILVSVVVVHCVSKNDTDVTHYRFYPHQPISVIFGRDVAGGGSSKQIRIRVWPNASTWMWVESRSRSIAGLVGPYASYKLSNSYKL